MAVSLGSHVQLGEREVVERRGPGLELLLSIRNHDSLPVWFNEVVQDHPDLLIFGRDHPHLADFAGRQLVALMLFLEHHILEGRC